MPLYTQSIKNLKGGISQQPDILRFSDQGETQINGWSSESDGLQKRPPTVWKKRLTALNEVIPDRAKFHLINRDENEQYYIVFTGSDIMVLDLEGNQYAVTGDMNYVNTDAPRDDIRVITVADYTFIVNRKRVVREGTEVSHPGYDMKHRALINLRGGQYGRTLTVSINGGAKVEHTLPAGNNAEEDPPKVDAQYIGAQLRTLLVAAYPNYTFNLGSGYLEIVAPAGQSITSVETTDGYANQLITAVIDTVQTISKLPLAAPEGYIIRIQGETNSSADEYYVRYDTQRKTWRETVEPGVTTGLDPETMPHALVRQVNGNFTFQTLNWSKRGAGNEDTNPMPSFVDNTINDVFFYRNRLGFLSGENVVMSRSASYFAFFPKSVATLSDDDPIDVAVSHPRISILKYAVPFAEQLLLWSDEVQFVMTSSGVLTSKSIQLDVGSEFAVSDNARPFAIGRSVFFAAPRGSFTSINRYFAVADVTDVKDADDTTGHVLSYIPNGVFDIQGSSTENFITVSTEGAPNKLFIYKFLFKDGVQLQASWSHWELEQGEQIMASACIGSSMYIVRKHGYGVDLEKLEFIKEAVDIGGEPYRLHLDGKTTMVIPTDAFNPDTYTSSFDVGVAYGGVFPPAGKYVMVDSGGRSVQLPDTVWSSTRWVTVKGDWSGKTVFIGRVYKFTYAFSRFLIKYEDQNGTITEDSGRLQLRRAWVNYQRTGALVMRVVNQQREFLNTLNGYKLGLQDIGRVNIGDGQFRFPMNGDALHTRLILESDYPTPVSIVGCGWEASYARKAKAI
ncbi:tail protein [Escherichia phage GA2A]|uniref:Tail tubular protein B n=1 Tax=Escherichia phage GA2A TaxID=1755695 RepID=A0A1B0TR62_9CAUD|nr:tail protein [Escherichia phage GA2A]ALP47809.1 tail tubular protein B [Escherichia phage GA2A]